MNYTKTGKAFDIVNFCQNKKNQKLCAVDYSKFSTSGNDPKLTKSMRYSQYVRKARPANTVIIPVDYINDVLFYLQTYAANSNIDLSTIDYQTQTIDFLNGKHITAYQYLEFLKATFGKNNVNSLLSGMYTLMPLEKATYLRHQAGIVSAIGNIMPHFRNYSFIFPR
jgi:hypothetical protein